MNDTEVKYHNAILNAEKELLLAMKNADVEKLDELIHEDLLFNIPNGQTVTKSMDLETYSSGNMKITDIEASEHLINFVGDNAIVSVIVEMKGQYFDYVIDGTFKIVRVWKLINNQWKVIAGSSIQLEAPL